MEETGNLFMRLVHIMDELREKCPWDQKQTIASLRSLTIEEMYELADAISREDWQNIKEELGDLLLHIVFYAKIGAEKNAFTLQEVIQDICEKLIFRHPHIYGDVVVKDEEEVKRNWEKLKKIEGKKSALDGVPAGLPGIVKALRIQEKAKQVGFEWKKTDDVFEKVEEEILELKQAILQDNQRDIEEEFGDVLFSLINFARFLQIDPENALERVNRKFISRFQAMEKLAVSKGSNIHALSLEEMDALWNEIKSNPL
ncbi:MAG: nucleoside triphosphate pyrophosphohydrolase [Bacteroidetes bacterium]|nr:nucleoside triphosphate pyrophosphohydrolase [Bacteroidota bacterium]